MATISKPYTFTNGATIIAAEHNDNFDTVYNEFNGNIDNANIKASAGIVDTKLAQITSANKVSAAAFANLASTPSGSGYLPLDNITGVVTTGANSTITSITGLTTPLALNQGGTAQTTANAALNALLPSQTGSSNNFLTTNGTNTSWGSMGVSNVIYCWLGSDNAATNTFGLKESASLNPDMSTYTINYHFFGVDLSTFRTILTGRFVKISAISTVTIHGRIWTEAGGTQNSVLKVDVGGVSNSVTNLTSSPVWATTSNISVSSLTNGTAYDITIQLAEASAGGAAYCSGVILTAS